MAHTRRSYRRVVICIGLGAVLIGIWLCCWQRQSFDPSILSGTRHPFAMANYGYVIATFVRHQSRMCGLSLSF